MKDDILFQFHNGTIKTYDSKIYGYKAEEFQFHNGTIKTTGFNLIL